MCFRMGSFRFVLQVRGVMSAEAEPSCHVSAGLVPNCDLVVAPKLCHAVGYTLEDLVRIREARQVCPC